MSNILEQLTAILAERKHGDPGSSYVASLHDKGLNKILEKVGEEATEVILAAKDAGRGDNKQALAGEVADLVFHNMVLLSHLDMRIDDVLEVLEQRFGTSGHEEKATRQGS